MFNKTSRTIKISAAFLIFFLAIQAVAATSKVIKFNAEEVTGKGPLPYNYRIVGQKIHCGGHPLNPKTFFRNSDKQVLEILNHLKSKGVKTIIDLENTWWIQKRYRKLLKQAGLKRLHIPMHISKVPTQKEWGQIKEAMKNPVYIHCKWGADRTGAVIARYLVEEKGYKPKEAWKAVITGGSHAGVLGGLKTSRHYTNLTLFFWPDAKEDEDFKKSW